MKYTPNLQLFEYEETQSDGMEKFLIQRALNDNWDKLDILIKRIQDDQASIHNIIDSIRTAVQPVTAMNTYIIDVSGGGKRCRKIF